MMNTMTTKQMYVVAWYPECDTKFTSVVLGVYDSREGAEEKVRMEIEQLKVIYPDPCELEGIGDMWICGGNLFRIEVGLNDMNPCV